VSSENISEVYELIWHGPVSDVRYAVTAESQEDAESMLMLYLNGEDEEGVREC
jgi:hypothetical protein